jgi:hypothetical protein
MNKFGPYLVSRRVSPQQQSEYKAMAFLLPLPGLEREAVLYVLDILLFDSWRRSSLSINGTHPSTALSAVPKRPRSLAMQIRQNPPVQQHLQRSAPCGLKLLCNISGRCHPVISKVSNRQTATPSTSKASCSTGQSSSPGPLS